MWKCWKKLRPVCQKWHQPGISKGAQMRSSCSWAVLHPSAAPLNNRIFWSVGPKPWFCVILCKFLGLLLYPWKRSGAPCVILLIHCASNLLILKWWAWSGHQMDDLHVYRCVENFLAFTWEEHREFWTVHQALQRNCHCQWNNFTNTFMLFTEVCFCLASAGGTGESLPRKTLITSAKSEFKNYLKMWLFWKCSGAQFGLMRISTIYSSVYALSKAEALSSSNTVLCAIKLLRAY